jgi:hypothetical protein
MKVKIESTETTQGFTTVIDSVHYSLQYRPTSMALAKKKKKLN